MNRNLLTVGLFLAVIAIGLFLLQRHQQPKPSVGEIVAAPPSVPALRGKPAANFELTNLEGTKVHMADFKNKVVLVNFWATWCAPCIVEIPWFIEFQKKYGPQGFEVVGISLDENGAKDVAPFVKKHGMTYPVLLGDDKVAAQFGGILGLPTTFIVDKNGKYYSMHRGLVGREAVEQELQTLLGQSAATPETPAAAPTPASEPEKHSKNAPRALPIPAIPLPQKS